MSGINSSNTYNGAPGAQSIADHQDVSSILAAVDFEKAKLHPMANLGGGVDYLFNSDDDLIPGMGVPQRGFGDDLCYGVGTTYITGLTLGGAWGLMEGLRSTRNLPPSFKVRLNGVLNGCTRRGPYLANSVGILAMIYTCTNASIGKIRGKNDLFNSMLAGGLAGALFRSAAGLRSAGIAGGICATLAAVWHTSQNSIINLPILTARNNHHA
ncbi:Tim17-domain-containing protein [Syncephalis fuscata]|nr:Tim17-domain-containing protein [Syncephalis fuscata]